MRLVIVILTLVLMSCAGSASAQDISRYRLPEGRIVDSSGQTYMAFDLGEYAELLRMDVDLRVATETVELADRALAEYEETVVELRAAVEAGSTAIDILQDERARLLRMWQEENRLRHEAENSVDLGEVVAWGIAAIVGIVAVTYITVDLLQ